MPSRRGCVHYVMLTQEGSPSNAFLRMQLITKWPATVYAMHQSRHWKSNVEVRKFPEAIPVIFYFYSCTCVSLCVCTSVCLPMPAETRREYWILWSWGLESCEQISVGVGGLILGLLEEQQVPLMAKSLLQSFLCSCKSAKYTRGTSSSNMLDFHPFLIEPDNHAHFSHHLAWCFFQASNFSPWTLLCFEYESPCHALAHVFEHLVSR